MDNLKLRLALFLGIALVAAGSAFAAKPESPGNSNAKKASQMSPTDAIASDALEGSHAYFNDVRTAILRSYYAGAYKSGHCPPGLAKKNNGCLPPGQLKQWRKGEHLPRDVVYYDLPAALIAELGRTPEGAKVVQAGAGLLLISVGTGLILDAMEIPQ